MVRCFIVIIFCLVSTILASVVYPGNYTDVEIETKYKSYLASRRRLQQATASHGDHHGRAWKTLEQVNGLNNTEVAVFITSSTAGEEHFMWDR